MNVRLVDAMSLFVTEEFRRSVWVRELCARVGKVWVWEDPPFGEHPELWSHFGTFFGAITRKKYDNPYIADLYFLHELTHVDTLNYDPGQNFVNWKRGFISSELIASLTSECSVYFHIPGIREKTFPHEIWVDRFLKNPEFASVSPRAVEPYISEARLRAVGNPHFADHYERQIAAYFDQNHVWCELWAEDVWVPSEMKKMPAFRIVLEHMSASDRNLTHPGWLEAQSFGTGIPFYNQAKAFSPIFQATSAKYGNHLLSR